MDLLKLNYCWSINSSLFNYITFFWKMQKVNNENFIQCENHFFQSIHHFSYYFHRIANGEKKLLYKFSHLFLKQKKIVVFHCTSVKVLFLVLRCCLNKKYGYYNVVFYLNWALHYVQLKIVVSRSFIIRPFPYLF